MITAIADTHAIIWYLYDDKRLSAAASQFFDNAVQQGQQIGIASISLVEIVYLSEKGRIDAQAPGRVFAALQNPASVLSEMPLNMSVVQALQQIPVTIVPEMPDRIIAATALHLQVPVISRDHKIQATSLTTIW
jgi:PIN domain nuclease of toxin-antitoxin system